jgi:hypothetical protein
MNFEYLYIFTPWKLKFRNQNSCVFWDVTPCRPVKVNYGIQYRYYQNTATLLEGQAYSKLKRGPIESVQRKAILSMKTSSCFEEDHRLCEAPEDPRDLARRTQGVWVRSSVHWTDSRYESEGAPHHIQLDHSDKSATAEHSTSSFTYQHPLHPTLIYGPYHHGGNWNWALSQLYFYLYTHC